MIYLAKRRMRAHLMIAAVIVAALQTGILGYLVESRAAILRNGADVLLKTAPVDPRDFLRGDYVALNYDVSTVPASTIVGPKPEEAGEVRLWVRLTPGSGGFWTIAESSFASLPEREGTVVLRSQPFRVYGQSGETSYHVDFGVERFYVPQGQGLALEAARREGVVSVALRVSKSGDAQIRSLLVDGKPVYEEPLY